MSAPLERARDTPPAAPRQFQDAGLISLATKRPIGVMMIVFTVSVFGLIAFDRLPRNLMPDIAYPTITVRTEYAGASPSDVEVRVSRRLEEVLSQVRSLRRVSSVSRAEVSDVVLEFAWNTNMALATMDVREKAEQAQLPDEVPKPTVLRYDPTLDPILQIGLLRKDEQHETTIDDLITLRLTAEDILERELETVEGVAAVRVRGGYEREIRIEVEEDQLKTRGLSMALINQRLKEENLNQASGQLYEGEQAYIVRTVNEFTDIDEVAEIILKRDGTTPIRLRDVARVSWSFEEPEVLTRVSGHACVKLEIYKEADANLVDVARRVRERVFGTAEERARLARILREEAREDAGERRLTPADDTSPEKTQDDRKANKQRKQSKSLLQTIPGLGGPPAEAVRPNFLASRLPPGETLVLMSDQSVFIQTALDDLRSTSISGGILAIAVLYLFLRSAWFTLAVGLSIPISVVATFMVFYATGVSFNLMSLGGLALGIGMLVDNSIVVLESIFCCREQGDSPRIAAVRGTQLVASAVVSSTLTTIAVFFPIVFVEGVAGQIFRDQALAVVVSLLASLCTALYIIPACIGRSAPPPLALAGGPAAPRAGAMEEVRRRIASLPWRWSMAPLSAVAAAFILLTGVTRAVLGATGFAISSGVFAAVRAAKSLRQARPGPLRRALNTGFDAWERCFAAYQRAYERTLRAALAHRALVLVLALGAVVISSRLFLDLGSELVPEVHQGEFTVDLRLPIGTRLERTDLVLESIEHKLLAVGRAHGLASLTATIGVDRDSLKASDEGEHTARLLVRLTGGRDLLKHEEELKSRFREELAAVPELSSFKLENPVLFTFKTPIEVEVKGHDLALLAKITAQLEEGMRRMPSLKDVKSTVASGFPEVRLRLDREILTRYGLSVASVGEAIRQKVQGEVPTYFNEGDRRIGLRVRLVEQDRTSLEDLAGLIINPASPVQLRLSDVVSTKELEVSEGPAEIRRIGQQRAAVVTANLTGVDLGRVTQDVRDLIAKIQPPPGFLVAFGGQKEEMDQSLSSLGKALLLAIFLVYVVMAMQFESLLQPLVILLTVPLAMVGVGPVLWLLGMSLSIVVCIGMIILAGIVVNNAIVLLDRVNQLRAEGMDPCEALVESGKVRMRPILMTTLTTVLGLLPLTGIFSGLPFVQDVPILAELLGTGEGSEIRAPLAVTVICGLTASMALTLIVIPVVDACFTVRRKKTAHG